MTTGEGGFVTTDDDRLADWLRLYRNQGMRERYHHEILGYNFRLTDVAAAIGLCPARQARAQHRPPPGDRGPLRRRASPDLPIGTPDHARRAGPTSSTSTRSTSASDRDAIVEDLRRGRRR